MNAFGEWQLKCNTMKWNTRWNGMLATIEQVGGGRWKRYRSSYIRSIIYWNTHNANTWVFDESTVSAKSACTTSRSAEGNSGIQKRMEKRNPWRMYMYARNYVFLIRVYIYTHTYTYAYIHIHIYERVCVYVCIYVSTYIVTFRNKIQRRT